MSLIHNFKEYSSNRLPHNYKLKIKNGLKIISIFRPKSLKPSFPSNILIDPANVCNLRCPLCPTGLNKLNFKNCVMSFNLYKMIVDKIPSLEHICLFNWGESFLNPSIFEMIRYTKEKNLRVTIHSHFSFKKNDNFFLKILRSGLDTLIISLDGASRQSYSKYKVGGDFDLVLSNIKKLVALREEQRYKKPNIIWKFIVNKFNEKEISTARKMANRLKIDFEIALLGLSDDLPGFDLEDSIEKRKEYWLPSDKRYKRPYYRGEYKIPLNKYPCTELFETIVVNSDGKVFPCCWVTDEKEAFGDLKNESFQDIWHNSKYQYSRSLFCKDTYSGSSEKTICLICNTFKKTKRV